MIVNRESFSIIMSAPFIIPKASSHKGISGFHQTYLFSQQTLPETKLSKEKPLQNYHYSYQLFNK